MTVPEYQVLLTPLVNPSTYGDTIDVTEDVDISEWIESKGLSSINSEIDQGDYDIGIYTYGSVSMTAINFYGKFNESQNIPFDPRSIFPWYRDRAKVEINFINSSETSTITFLGLIADKATRQDLSKQTVSFTVLSQDSIFKQLQVSPGAVINGMTFSQAFQAILNVSEITAILNYDQANINPKIDLTVDDGSKFDNLLVKTALDKLLLASNSVLLLDESDIIVRSRTENSNTPHNLYLNDEQKRDNIDTITGFNNGLQRMFNSVFINDTEASDQDSKDTFFVREKRETLSFITNTANELIIANSVLDDFGNPKTEMQVKMDTEAAEDIEVLDKVTVKKNFKLSEYPGKKAALYEIDEYEKSYYTVETGDVKLNENIIYKVVGFFKAPETFKTILKIRETGEVL